MVLEVVSKHTSAALLDDVVRLEKRRVQLIFPKHESMTETLVKEALKPTCRLSVHDTRQELRSLTLLVECEQLGVGHIDKLAVAPAHRRQGVGGALLASALAHLQSGRATSATLVVDVARAGAIALYEAAGFSAVARRVDYYQPGRHALVMQRALS